MKINYSLKVSILIIVLIKTILLFSNSTALNLKSKYFIKKEVKTPDLNEFNIPAEPELAHDIYPIIQRNLIDLDYNEMMPGADLGQIEVIIGKTLPGNLPIVAPYLTKLPNLANKIKTSEIKKKHEVYTLIYPCFVHCAIRPSCSSK